MAFCTFELRSRMLDTHVGVTMILPEGKPPVNGWRTLWLLHGMSDDDTIWTRRTSIERYVPDDLAVVMPSAELSCYSDMTHGKAYYTYLTRELPMILRDLFALSSRREDNYVAGLSMGGEGAFKIGLANPEKYSAIGCLSAGVFNHPWATEWSAERPWLFLCHDGKTLDGSPEDGFGSARRILAEGKPVPRIYHAIGKSDFLLESAHETRDFFESLEGNPFGYVYEEDEGTHNWDFWDAHIVKFLEFLRVNGN